MKKLIYLSLLVFIHYFLFCGLATAAKKSDEPIDSIVAVVNDAVITQKELDKAIDTIKKQLQGSSTPPPAESILRKQVLDQLVNRKLQLQLAEQAGIHVTDADITKAVNNIAKQNHITVKELYDKLASQRLTPAEYHKELREEIALQSIQQQEVGSKITITPHEVSDFTRSSAWVAYNNKEYHIEDILIALPDTPSTQDVATAKKRADELLA